MKLLRAAHAALGALTRPRGKRWAKASPRRVKRRKQRGVAIITVIVAIGLTLVMTNDFGTATTIDLMAAANYRDQMRAHFLARSAQNLAELVIRLQQRLDNIPQLAGQVQITDFADQVLLAFCGSPEEVEAAIGMSTADSKGLGADIGTCGVSGQLTTEDDKINLNCANNPTYAEALTTVLNALVYFPAYDTVFEEEDAEGWRRDRATQVAAIIDYIDVNGVRLSDRGTTESYGYESLKDPYRARNNYVDTLGEVKLARGVDDRFWTLFGSAFTVYGGCKTNLSTLNNTQLIAGLLQASAKNPSDPMLLDPRNLFALAGLVASAKIYGVNFTSVDDFVSFVKDPQSAIGALAMQTGTFGGSAAGAAISQGIPQLQGGVKLGMELDKAKLGQIATAGPRRTYRVQTWGEINRLVVDAQGQPVFPPIRVTVDAVWDTKVVPQNARNPPAPKGAWVFQKED